MMLCVHCRSLAQRPEPLVSAWMVGAPPLTQIYKYLNMAQGEASCAAEWSAFVRNNISTPVLTYITAGKKSIHFCALCAPA